MPTLRQIIDVSPSEPDKKGFVPWVLFRDDGVRVPCSLLAFEDAEVC